MSEKLNPKGLAHVEALIDTYGLSTVLDAVADLCTERSQRYHAKGSEILAAHWWSASSQISGVAAHLRVQRT